MKKIILWVTMALLTSAFVFTSCEKKNDDNPPTSNQQLAEDEALADTYWNAIDKDVDFASQLMEGNHYKSVTDTCPMIIVNHPDSVFFPRTIIIDYGEDYCETWNGSMKKGKIIIEVSSPIALPGSVRSVNLENFYINEKHIEGTKTLTNKGFNDSGNLNFDVILADGKITFPDGAIITRVMNHNNEWTQGLETPNYWWDNEWLIRGTASGTNRNGVSYQNEIVNPVLVKSLCHFPVSGTININITDLGTLVFDYGNGECDNIATITFGDEVWEITLGK